MKIAKLVRLKDKMNLMKDRYQEIEAKKVQFQKEISHTLVLRELGKIKSNLLLDLVKSPISLCKVDPNFRVKCPSIIFRD